MTTQKKYFIIIDCPHCNLRTPTIYVNNVDDCLKTNFYNCGCSKDMTKYYQENAARMLQDFINLEMYEVSNPVTFECQP